MLKKDFLNKSNLSQKKLFATGSVLIGIILFVSYVLPGHANALLGSGMRVIGDSQHYRVKPTLSIDQQQRVGDIVGLVSDRNREFIVTLHEDGSVRQWDLKRGIQVGGSIGSDIIAVAIQDKPRKNTLVAVHQDGSAVLYHIDGTQEQMWQSDSSQLDRGQRPVLSEEGRTMVYKSVDGNWHAKVENGQAFLLPNADPKFTPVLSPDGSKVFFRIKNGNLVVARLTDRVSSSQNIEACNDRAAVTAGVFSQTAGRLVIGDEKGNFCIWSVANDGSAPKRVFKSKLKQKVSTGGVRSSNRDSNVPSLVGIPIQALYFSEDDKSIAVSGINVIGIWSQKSNPNKFKHIDTVTLNSEPETILLDAARERLLMSSNMGIMEIHALDAREQTLVARLISTKTGWSVIDQFGRFDGTQSGIDALTWSSGHAKDNNQFDLPVDSFFESYYEPGLLAKLDDATQTEFLTGKVDNLDQEGYFRPPKVLIEQIPPQNKEAGDQLSVFVRKAENDSYANAKIEAIRLYQNDKLVAEGKLNENETKIKFSVRLTAGENKFRAVGIGPESIEGPPSEQVVQIHSTQEISNSMRVVSIAVSNYDYKPWNLKYPLNDSKTFVKEVGDRSAPLFDTIRVNKLDNTQAQKETIKKQILSDSDDSPSEVLVVYFSGHGYAIQEKERWDWYLIPYTSAWQQDAASVPKDYTTTQRIEKLQESVRKNGLSSSELMAWLRQTHSQKVFLILDACQSGAMVEAFQTVQNSEFETPDDAVAQKALHRLAKVGGIHVLAASRAQELAVELETNANKSKAEQHGALTYLVLEGVRGAADGAAGTTEDGRVSVRELIEYSVAKMPYLANQLNQKPISQKPVGFSKGSDFNFAQL